MTITRILWIFHLQKGSTEPIISTRLIFLNLAIISINYTTKRDIMKDLAFVNSLYQIDHLLMRWKEFDEPQCWDDRSVGSIGNTKKGFRYPTHVWHYGSAWGSTIFEFRIMLWVLFSVVTTRLMTEYIKYQQIKTKIVERSEIVRQASNNPSFGRGMSERLIFEECS